MIDPKRTCGNCDYFTVGANGHGTCHVAAPGSIARNGFPIIAASDWCAKGATGGVGWATGQEQSALLRVIEVLHQERKEAASERNAADVVWHRLNALKHRNLWQRICNTVPWKGK